MTVQKVSVAEVACDKIDHPGANVFRVEHGAAVTLNDALREAGWTVVLRGLVHFCPRCGR